MFTKMSSFFQIYKIIYLLSLIVHCTFPLQSTVEQAKQLHDCIFEFLYEVVYLAKEVRAESMTI